MIFYANPSTEPIRDAIAADRLGCIMTPHQGNVTFPEEWDTIADNGCFSNRWTEHHWRDWILSLPRSVRFVVVPDVFDPRGVPTHDATLERWERFAPFVKRHGFVPAFVCQVGATPANIPGDASVVFLGGTTAWKLGDDAEAIAHSAHADGRWVHMGRVNSLKRMRIAQQFRCDSVDGTYLTYGPDVNLPKLLAMLEHVNTQPMLWEDQ